MVRSYESLCSSLHDVETTFLAFALKGYLLQIERAAVK